MSLLEAPSLIEAVVGLFKPRYVKTHYKRPHDAKNGTE